MSSKTSKDDVLRNLVSFLGDKPLTQGRDNRGPDHIHISEDGKRYYFETIAFSAGSGKNQSDFWKAFAQAISRLNLSSQWGHPDYVVLALPGDFLSGWKQRVAIHGEDVWQRIGNAFPQLQIWFVSEGSLLRKPWNDAYHAAD